MTRSYAFHDWREMARIVNLVARFGCALEEVAMRARDGLYHTTLELTGDPEALRRLDAQLTKITLDDKEMAR